MPSKWITHDSTFGSKSRGHEQLTPSCPQKILKRGGGISLPRGNSSPSWGNSSPNGGNSSPDWGNSSPNWGNSSPKQGNSSPTGTTLSKSGEELWDEFQKHPISFTSGCINRFRRILSGSSCLSASIFAAFKFLPPENSFGSRRCYSDLESS